MVVNVELASGAHKIAVGVRDEINRVASYHRATIELAEDEKVGLGSPSHGKATPVREL